MKNARLEVIDILDKMQFFQGQRAGRELWNEKPFNIQEQDIDNFNRHIRTIRDYIWDLERKLKAYEDAEEQGLLLRLPCKVGDTVYLLKYRVGDWEVEPYTIKTLGYVLQLIEHGLIGELAFLTPEEAEEEQVKRLAEIIK